MKNNTKIILHENKIKIEFYNEIMSNIPKIDCVGCRHLTTRNIGHVDTPNYRNICKLFDIIINLYNKCSDCIKYFGE